MIYKNEFLNEISFPLGGIGTGCIGLAGNGRLVDWEIFNRPAKGSTNGYSFIAVKAVKNGKIYTKILQSDLTKEYIGKYSKKDFTGFGYGHDSISMSGFPHFRNCEFNGEFPIAELKFTDDNFPGEVILRAFNPFIPLDAKNSSIPSAFFEIEYKNTDNEDVEFEAVFSLENPSDVSRNTILKNGNITSIKLSDAQKKENETGYCDLSISCNNPTIVQQNWYRGRWKDGISVFWNEFIKDCGFIDRKYNTDGCHDGSSIGKRVKIASGDKSQIRFVLSWNVPNNNNYWSEDLKTREVTWKNYYATVFKDSVESGIYSLNNRDELYLKTIEFKNELFSSSLDDVIKEAISSTLSVLKSPTVYRLENGEFYGFEGIHEEAGSCEGTCQHVYNYVYSLCFLFPELEQSIRDVEFKHSTLESGGTRFRVTLPLGYKAPHNFSWNEYDLPCIDGHLGCVIKTYREWKISGDNEWLKSVWPTVQKILEFTWSPENKHEWDLNKDGVLEGRQHHTLDAELFGPSSWLEGFYLAALKSASEMAEFLGCNDKADEYKELYEKGRKWTEENLFNGEYFIHKIDVNDKTPAEHFKCESTYWNEEAGQMKYQVANGSSIDQLTAQWHANILGLGNIFNKNQVKTALKSMMKNNFKQSMREITNIWRVFATDDEAGTIMCDYPEGTTKPIIPLAYCEECMTGFEYQFAGLLISEGFYEDGIRVIKAVRNRYDGKKRNPWNEIECGSNYIRAMASYALIPILSGFIFDLPNYKIGFNPLINKDNFRCIWSLGTGWGNVIFDKNSIKINLISGTLNLGEIVIPDAENTEKLIIDGNELVYAKNRNSITFERKCITKSIEILR